MHFFSLSIREFSVKISRVLISVRFSKRAEAVVRWRVLLRFREKSPISTHCCVSTGSKRQKCDQIYAFTVVFSKLAKLPNEGDAPYAVLVFAALLPWQFFSNALTESSNSLIGNTNLISKVYFPRLIIPASSVITSFVDFLISFVIMIGLMIYYQYLPSWQMVFLPVFLIIAFLASFGFGLLITTLNVKYRDFRYIVPFIVQLGLYISPVGFSSKIIPEKWRLLYSINPMVGVIDGFRWSILGEGSTIYLPGFFISLGVIILLLWFSIVYFRKMEKSFADYI